MKSFTSALIVVCIWFYGFSAELIFSGFEYIYIVWIDDQMRLQLKLDCAQLKQLRKAKINKFIPD